MDPFVEGLSSRPELLAAGVTDDELRRLRARRELVALRPGAYVEATDQRLQDPVARHALTVRAAILKATAGAVVSHVSAAVLHGLPVWGVTLGRVHVTRSRRSGGRVTRTLHLHAAALDRAEVTEVDGISVTTVARTVADLAGSLPFDQAVVVADAALNRRLVSPEELRAAVDQRPGRAGNPGALRVVEFADRRSESVGESRSRVVIARAGLPAPVLQHDVYSSTGLWLGRVDFWWPRYRTAGEFDGKIKYGRLLRPGQQPGDAVFAEKRREDLIRSEHIGVARWTWDELDHFHLVVPRLRRVFAYS